MKISNNGIALIKQYEGCKLAEYICPAGKRTIGYGHTKGVVPGQKITKLQADNFLRQDLMEVEKSISLLVKKPLNQNQFDSIASFIFNFGATKFSTSTLLKKINVNPNDLTIANEFKRWIYSDNKISSGLIKRRNAEVKLYYS